MKRNFEFPIVSLNKNDYESVMKWIRQEKELLIENVPLYIYGAGIRGNMILVLLKKEGFFVKGFIDGAINKIGGNVGSYPIFSFEEIIDREGSDVRIIISPENSYDIEELLKKSGLREEKNYWVIRNRIYDIFFEDFRSALNAKYIAFGDCFFTDLDIDGLGNKTIGEILSTIVDRGQESLKILSLHGMCMPGFYHLMKILLSKGASPNSVAFIVNVPFCNSIQTKLPQSQHYELFRMIMENMDITDVEFSEYVDITRHRSKNINGNVFATSGKRDSEHIEKILTKERYMYEFNEDNENIVYMKKMIELLVCHGIKPVPFIPALNYSIAYGWFADEFIERYEAICRRISDIVQSYNVELLDMSRLLRPDQYIGNHMTKFPNAEGEMIESCRIKAALIQE